MSEKDELTQTIAECRYAKIGEGQGNTTSGALAEALLASDWLAEHDRKVAARALREFRKHMEERRDGASTQLISDCASFTIGAVDGYLIRQQIEKGARE